jgi:hypothetical protein
MTAWRMSCECLADGHTLKTMTDPVLHGAQTLVLSWLTPMSHPLDHGRENESAMVLFMEHS